MKKLHGFVKDIPKLIIMGKIIIKESKPFQALSNTTSFEVYLGKKVLIAEKWFPKWDKENHFTVIKDRFTWISIESIKVHI